MKRVHIPIKHKQYLSDALKDKGYLNIPRNTILKKTLPGLGATYGEIKAKRHSIIIEPNVPVITGKTKDKPELLGVYEGVTKSKIEKYVKNREIKYKKLITTPESYHLIKEVCLNRNVKIDYYKDFFCLFDECEKLIQDVDYRNKITQPITDFFLFENKAFVSATALDMIHPEFENQNFQIMEVEPAFGYKKDLELIITNTYEVAVYNKLMDLKDSAHICIFLNKTDSIDKLINTLGIEKQSKIFCSEKSVQKLKKKEYNIASDSIELPLAKYNFFTCRFFSAVDITLKYKPDIIILTNLKDANHTMIDPFTEAIQIYGRFRDKHFRGEITFNSLTHITNINTHFKVKTGSDIDRVIEIGKGYYDELKQDLEKATDDITKEAITKHIQSTPYTELLDQNGNINYFSQDNLYNEERVKGYYSNPELLIQAYKGTGHFNVTEIVNNSPFTFDTDYFQMKNVPTKDKRKHIVMSLEELLKQKEINPDFDIKAPRELIKQVEITSTERGEFIVECFDYLGKERIEEIGYTSPKKLGEALIKSKSKRKVIDLFHVIQDEIRKTHDIGIELTKNEAKELISDIYKDNGIELKVIQDTIKIFCKVSENNSKSPSTYTIKGFKSELDINSL